MMYGQTRRGTASLAEWLALPLLFGYHARQIGRLLGGMAA
jgi:hypothetical protein